MSKTVEHTEPIKQTKLHWYFLVALVLVFGVLFWLFFKPSQSLVKLRIFSSLNVPVGFSFGSPVFYKEYQKVDSLVHVPNATTQPNGLVTWNQLMDVRLIDKLSSQSKFTISDQEVESELAALSENLKTTPSELISDFVSLHKVGKQDFISLVLVTNLKRAKLAADFSKATFNTDTRRNTADTIIKDTKSVDDFISFAKKYSEDTASKSFGANVGFKKKSELVPEIQSQLDFTKIKHVQTAYSRQGVHLVYIAAIDKTDPLNLRYDIYQIFFAIKGFDDYLAAEKQKEKSFFLLN